MDSGRSEASICVLYTTGCISILNTLNTEAVKQERIIQQGSDKDGGLLPAHLAKLTDDGLLQRLLMAHVGHAADSTLQKVLSAGFGPTSPLIKALNPTDAAGLKLQLENMVRTELEAQRQKITREFSMDHEDSPLRKLLKQLEDKHLSLGQGLNTRVNQLIEQLTP